MGGTLQEPKKGAGSRLRREDCPRTKHDSVFSKWEILIGPDDWENYSLGKDGTERYRIHNLPLSCSCPGLYELGIAASCPNEGRNIRKLDSRHIVVVYLGQADNVRTRLQHYGRAGSHLDHGKSTALSNKNESHCLQRPGLFKEIFSRGFSIVFRWVPIKTKKEAVVTEAMLLEIFDYAWNKQGNGACRRDDILLKLDTRVAHANPVNIVLRKLCRLNWHPFSKKQPGIRISACEPLKEEDESANDPVHNLSTRVFKVVVFRPRITSRTNTGDEDYGICGVAKDDGSICRNKPILRRKRCEEHKGKRINGTRLAISRKGFETGGTSHVCGAGLEDGSPCMEIPSPGRKKCEVHKGRRILSSKVHVKAGGTSRVCGVGLEDGSLCMEIPSPGRKRCEVHKGRRIMSLKVHVIPESKSVK